MTADDASAHEASERAQFEAIGRFVQAFEGTVEVCRRLLSIMIPTDGASQAKLNLVLHHQALSAWPLFELARNVSIMHVTQRAPEEQATALNSIFAQAASDFEKLVDVRNSLLHGTWRIGWRSPIDEPSDRLSVYKFKPTRGELRPSASLPGSVGDLLSWVEKSNELSRALEYILAVLIMPGGPRVVENFRKVDGRWSRIPQGLA